MAPYMFKQFVLSVGESEGCSVIFVAILEVRCKLISGSLQKV